MEKLTKRADKRVEEGKSRYRFAIIVSVRNDLQVSLIFSNGHTLDDFFLPPGPVLIQIERLSSQLQHSVRRELVPPPILNAKTRPRDVYWKLVHGTIFAVKRRCGSRVHHPEPNFVWCFNVHTLESFRTPENNWIGTTKAYTHGRGRRSGQFDQLYLEKKIVI